MSTTARSNRLTIDQIQAIRSVGGSEAPQWLPDGSQIIFASGVGGGPELWSVWPDGGPLTRLTVGMGGVGHLATFMPMCAPSGDYLSYVSAKTGADEVWLWSPDGSPDIQLTRLGARVEAMSWAPDGKSVAVAANAFGTFDIFSSRFPPARQRS